MYPTIYDLVKDLFGLELSFLRVVNSFGLMVAFAFIAAHYFISKRLKEYTKMGLFKPSYTEATIGKPYSTMEYITNAIVGFLMGYKLIYLFANTGAETSPQKLLLSFDGSWLWGIIIAILLSAYKYYEDKKQQLPEPITRKKVVYPHNHMSNITLIAAIAGIVGAKIFHWMEYPEDFARAFESAEGFFSGLTFYGGMIMGTIAVLIYLRRINVNPWLFVDAGGMALMLAYGVGRIGCHVAGDGDWGVVNSAKNTRSWLPDWMWSYSYPNNVNHDFNPYIEGSEEYVKCAMENDWESTQKLVENVWPTPFYEAIAGILIFIILWNLRNRIKYVGVLFGIYLLFNGVERFFIEKIRVNAMVDFLGMRVTQAEIISSGIFLLGLIVIGISLYRKQKITDLVIVKDTNSIKME